MLKAARLRLRSFDPGRPLIDGQLEQERYVRAYLTDLGAESILEEPHYFDRDYLSEFEGYYATSARGYPNVCRRLHFFSVPLTRAKLLRLFDGNTATRKNLRAAYLGFCVIRPLPASPFGKTVLAWYPERDHEYPRVTESRRRYTCHIAGVPFWVEGLAWQQQDSSVSACATIALWSMLQSSAFSEDCSIPTTYQVTEAAHRGSGGGRRVFPSRGLVPEQVGEAIKQMGLEPVRIDGNIPGSLHSSFSPARFSPLVCGLLRSGYPILVGGGLWRLENGVPVEFIGMHAVCMSGFREPRVTPGSRLQDQTLRYVYIHDDNLGPNVRYEVRQRNDADILLSNSSPRPRFPARATLPRPQGTVGLIPNSLFIAVHHGIRIDILDLYQKGLHLCNFLQHYLQLALERAGENLEISAAMSFRFIAVHEYLGAELPSTLDASRKTAALGSTVSELVERVAPMSKHLGLIRIALDNTPSVDLLYDTTEIDRFSRCFAHVILDNSVALLQPILNIFQQSFFDLGVRVVVN